MVRTAGRLWPFEKATLGAQQIDAERGIMMDEEGAAEEEDINHTARLLCPFGEVDAVVTGQRTEEPDVVEDGVHGRPKSVISRIRVQRGALSVIITQRTISTRQHPVEDEIDPEVTFKTLSKATAGVAKPSSRTIATRGEKSWLRAIYRLGSESRYWAQQANKYTDIWTRSIRADHKWAWCYGSIRQRTRHNEAGRSRLYRSKTQRISNA